MRYLITILLFTAFTAYGQTTKVVNGQVVPLTQEEITALQSEWTAQDSIARDSVNVKKLRTENQINRRTERLARLMVYMTYKLNDTQTANFCQSTRGERSDYPYAPDALITWFNVTFPTKNYFDATIQTRALKILNGTD